MKKIISFLCVILMVLAVAGCSQKTTSQEPSKEDSGKVYKLTFASFDSVAGSLHNQIEVPMVKMLKEKSDGRIQVEVFSSSAISGTGTTVDAVLSGTADMGVDTTGAYRGRYPLTDFLNQPGLGIPSGEVGSEIYREFVNTIGASEYADLKVFAAFHTGPMSIISVKPIATAKDMAGKRLRTGASLVEALKIIGATPVDMPTPDAYEAMRTNVIDGAVAAPLAIPAFKFNEVAKYVTYMPQFSATQMIIMNKKSYESLPPDLQKVVDEVAEATFNNAKTYFDTMNATAVKTSNMTVVEASAAQQKEWDMKLGVLAQAYAKSLDDKGKKGTETLNWINEKLKAYNK